MKTKFPMLSIQRLAAIAMLMGLLMVVENYLSLRFSETLQFQFTFIPYTVLGAIAGPIWSMVAAVVIDPIQVLMSGQQFLIGFVLIEAVSAFLYGWFFYKKPLSMDNAKDWLYVISVVVLILGVTSFVMTPLVLHAYYDIPWKVLYASRALKAIVEVPLRVTATMLLMPRLQEIPAVARLMGLK